MKVETDEKYLIKVKLLMIDLKYMLIINMLVFLL